MSTKECLLCIKIPLGEAMIYTFDLFEDQEIAKFIAVESGELLKEAWLKDRFTMCGRSRIGLLGGSIYINSMLNHVPISQKKLADVLGITSPTVQRSYRTLLKILPNVKKQYDIIRPIRKIKPVSLIKPIEKFRKHQRRCIMCKNIPNAEDFEDRVIRYKTYDGEKTNYGYLILFNTICKFNEEANLRNDNLTSNRNCNSFEKRYRRSNIKSRLNKISSKILSDLENGSYGGAIIDIKAIING
jgi:hypothetical protein